MKDQKGPLADDILELSKRERTKREERATGVRRQIEIDWQEGWELFDAVVFSVQQSGLLLGRRSSDIEDEYSAVRFSIGNIRETFGEVVATIYREFPSN